MKIFRSAACFCLLMITACSQKQGPQKPNPVHRKSPIAITNVTDTVMGTYVKITYGQPYKKGRKIFGGAIKYGEVWRTGANEATEMTTTGPLQFNGNHLKAGTYELFTIPGRKHWTIILNDSLGQWGAFDYNKNYDHLRTEIKPKEMKKMSEAFTIRFANVKHDTTSIILKWDTTKVAVPIRFVRRHSVDKE